jgi:hypothetical protein
LLDDIAAGGDPQARSAGIFATYLPGTLRRPVNLLRLNADAAAYFTVAATQ